MPTTAVAACNGLVRDGQTPILFRLGMALGESMTSIAIAAAIVLVPALAYWTLTRKRMPWIPSLIWSLWAALALISFGSALGVKS